MNRHLLILTALKHEAAAIEKGLKREKGLENRYRIYVIGPGAGKLSQLQKMPVDGIVMAGLAGGLDPQLRCGDVVIDEASQSDVADSIWRRGKFHSAASIIASPKEKGELFRATGALVVDMESDAARKLATEWSVPYLGIRAVLDCADEALDPALLRLTSPSGGVRAGAVVSQLLRRPTTVATLLRMQSRSAFALKNLSAAIAQILQRVN